MRFRDVFTIPQICPHDVWFVMGMSLWLNMPSTPSINDGARRNKECEWNRTWPKVLRLSKAVESSHRRILVFILSSVFCAHSCWMAERAIIVDPLAPNQAWLSGSEQILANTLSDNHYSKNIWYSPIICARGKLKLVGRNSARIYIDGVWLKTPIKNLVFT